MNAKTTMVTVPVSGTDVSASGTDWERLRRRNDAEIDYSDAPPMNRRERKNLRIRLPDGRRIPVKPLP